MIAIAIPGCAKASLIAIASILVFVFIGYRFFWRMAVRKYLTGVGFKRTGLVFALLISFIVFIELDSLLESILYAFGLLLFAVVIGGIPPGKKKADFIKNDRLDFREGGTLWEKIKIWIFY